MIRKYAEIFCWKNVSSFGSAKATHIFSAKNIRLLYIESTKTVNEMTLNELVKLTTLWTTGPWIFFYYYYLEKINIDIIFWIVCCADDSHEMARLIFFEKVIKKKVKMSSVAVVLGALRIHLLLYISNLMEWFITPLGTRTGSFWPCCLSQD